MGQRVDVAFDGTLGSFFFEQLEEVQEGEEQALGGEIGAYLVHMLAAYARRPQVAGRTSPALATQFLAARERGPVALREVGDRALYIAGVVPRSLDRGAVNVEYVAGIGASAYREVHAHRSRLEVFAQMAERFREMVAVVGRMLVPGEGEDLLTVYERWRRSGEARDATRLLAAGLVLDRGRADILQ